MTRMERITDWALLWRQIVTTRHSGRRARVVDETDDLWQERATAFDSRVRRRWDEASSIRETLLAHVDSQTTVLDVGAGTGAWAIPLARHVARVTALDPSPSMRAILERHVDAQQIENIDVVDGLWPDVADKVERHDLVLCSHAMYGAEDLVAFVERLQAAARRDVFLIIREPSLDSLMSEAALIVWGQPHFVPDFTVAYNLLLGMGLHPHVTMEQSVRSRTDSSPTFEAAVGEMKVRLGLASTNRTFDDELLDLARTRLIPRNGGFDWPGTLRSALVHWSRLPVATTPGPLPGAS